MSGRAKAAYVGFSFASRLSFGLGARRIERCAVYYGLVHRADFSLALFSTTAESNSSTVPYGVSQ